MSLRKPKASTTNTTIPVRTKKYILLGECLRNLYDQAEIDEKSLEEITRIVQTEGLDNAQSISQFLVNSVRQMQENSPKNRSFFIPEEKQKAIQEHIEDAPSPKIRKLFTIF